MSGIPESQKSESAQSVKAHISTRREKLTQKTVRELFDYRNGELIRKTRPAMRTNIGDIVGCNSNGYSLVAIDNKTYKVHRVIWLWHHGYLPEHGIDHINRNRSDNKIENLREVSHVCNMRNTGTPKNNISGVKGVYWSNQRKKWVAQITVSDRHINIGGSTDFLEAVCLRLASEQALGWAGCDDCSPAFQYVKKHLRKDADNFFGEIPF